MSKVIHIQNGKAFDPESRDSDRQAQLQVIRKRLQKINLLLEELSRECDFD